VCRLPRIGFSSAGMFVRRCDLHRSTWNSLPKDAILSTDDCCDEAPNLPICLFNFRPCSNWLNLKTAKTLGLDLPATMLGRANEVFE
jgi:hypothetical protein